MQYCNRKSDWNTRHWLSYCKTNNGCVNNIAKYSKTQEYYSKSSQFPVSAFEAKFQHTMAYVNLYKQTYSDTKGPNQAYVGGQRSDVDFSE